MEVQQHQIDYQQARYRTPDGGKVVDEQQTRTTVRGQPEQPISLLSGASPQGQSSQSQQLRNKMNRPYAVPADASEEVDNDSGMSPKKDAAAGLTGGGGGGGKQQVTSSSPSTQPHGYLSTMTVGSGHLPQPREVLHRVEERVVALPVSLRSRLQNLPPEAQLESLVDLNQLGRVLKASANVFASGVGSLGNAFSELGSKVSALPVTQSLMESVRPSINRSFESAGPYLEKAIAYAQQLLAKLPASISSKLGAGATLSPEEAQMQAGRTLREVAEAIVASPTTEEEELSAALQDSRQASAYGPPGGEGGLRIQ